jgi:putative membrane protein
MKKVLYLVVTVVVVLLGITFALHNRQTVEIAYYFGLGWNGPLALALLATFAAGAVVGYLMSLRMVVRMQRELVRSRKEIRQIEQEVQNLRALPIKDVL